jgi:hypothetical protein
MRTCVKKRREDAMNYQDLRRPPPARKVGDGPQIEQLPGQLSASRFNQDVPPPQADLPAETVLEVIDGLRFDALVEASNLAAAHAKQTRRAAQQRDRRGARLHGCQTSRAVRSMLLALEELNLAGGRR